MKKWTSVTTSLPEKMKSVLISDKNGKIRKAFINIGGIWIIQNTNSVPSLFYNDESMVLAWMPLPNVYKKYSHEGWILTSKSLPKNDIPVLISTKDEVFISYCRSGNSDMWWLRNSENKDSQKVYLSKHSVIAWMPLPESFNTSKGDNT